MLFHRKPEVALSRDTRTADIENDLAETKVWCPLLSLTLLRISVTSSCNVANEKIRKTNVYMHILAVGTDDSKLNEYKITTKTS